ncbi:MAG: Na+/H+ antiporter NhaC family protein [Ruminococcaceae bacterium]|nr:Na+/H+ antiporter NhaC family protein [Oscillospiraceae bacterium]
MLTATTFVSFAAGEPPEVISPAPASAPAQSPASDPAASTDVVVTVDDEDNEYDLTTDEGASAYVDSYADNLTNDSNFESNIQTAIAKVRESIKSYATFWALVPPIIAIVLALITKEVYSSLFIGILAGGLIYSNFNLETTMVHVFKDGFIDSVADPYNIGIIIFLVLLGSLVAMMNKTGGSAAFGRWASKHIKSTLGAQLATIALGVLIFIDDYFNCLTVGSVMRPVTDQKKISREKLSYLIDATAAPVCIIAPISSWAAAVAGFAKGAGAESGMSLFVRAIPFNFYAILTIVMMLFIAFAKFDYGPMKKFESAARMGKAIEEIDARKSDELKENDKGKVIDLLIPVIFLIIACVLGMIYSGGFFTEGEEGYRNFIVAFSNSDASVGLVYGSFVTIIFAVIYFLCRRVISFKDCLEAVPEGLKAMAPAILILVCAWTLKAMTDSIGAKIFISQLVEGSAGSFQMFLPAIIFAIAVGLSFATGTSWGTFGILIPIVLSVFSGSDGNITIIAVSACMAGAVCGDHCSPISDTTIMASAGAECNHINHVSTQLPYALTVAGVSFVTYIIAGFIQSAWIALPIGIALMVGTLFVLKMTLGKKGSKEAK